jgi:hypothetical protein
MRRRISLLLLLLSVLSSVTFPPSLLHRSTIMWRIQVDRAAPDCDMQSTAYAALDAIADNGFLQCLLHSVSVALAHPEALFVGTGNDGNSLARPALGIARMGSRACWLIAVAPPS